MKAKIKEGAQLLFTCGARNYWSNLTDKMIINFNNKGTYIHYTQWKNHLLIDTTEGPVDIIFTGSIPDLEFVRFDKDQLVLKINEKN